MSKNKLRLEKSLLSQYLLVFFAFLLMVMISNYFAGDIVAKHLSTYGEEAIAASAEVQSSLLAATSAFVPVSAGCRITFGSLWLN